MTAPRDPPVAVVIPAHDEERLIGRCLASVEHAAERIDRPVHVVVACDACGDATERIVHERGHVVVRTAARNVGAARAAGAAAALALGAGWLAFTDADTIVEPEWLADQLALDCDAVCGTVGVDDWSAYDPRVRADFETNYVDRDGHRHVHGANLGICATAYRAVGGFVASANHEDVAIVAALEAAGARVVWSARPRVRTSVRRDFRATAGFGATVAAMAASIVGQALTPVARPLAGS